MNLQDYYFFKSLSKQEIKKLESISFVKIFSRGDILFYQGDQSKYLHLLVDGIVKVYKHDFKDNEILIHNINAISFIAEIANYEEIPFPANCSFETKGEVVFIDYKKFREEFLYKKRYLNAFYKIPYSKDKIFREFYK